MTTALTKLNGNYTETQLAVMAEMDSEGDAGFVFIPERIKFSAGGMLAFQTANGEILQPPIDMIVAIAQRTAAYWPTKETLGSPPLCQSRDGIEGFFDTESELVKVAATAEVRHPALAVLDKDAASGPWSCATCPLNQWGEGASRAKPCKNMRRLAVLVKGWAAPAILSVPPTSTKVWDAFASGRKNRGKAYFDTWVHVALSKDRNKAGTEYAKLVLTVGDALNDGELAEVIAMRHQYVELVRSLGIVSDDYATEDPEDAAARAFKEAPVSNEETPF